MSVCTSLQISPQIRYKQNEDKPKKLKRKKREKEGKVALHSFYYNLLYIQYLRHYILQNSRYLTLALPESAKIRVAENGRHKIKEKKRLRNLKADVCSGKSVKKERRREEGSMERCTNEKRPIFALLAVFAVYQSVHSVSRADIQPDNVSLAEVSVLSWPHLASCVSCSSAY